MEILALAIDNGCGLDSCVPQKTMTISFKQYEEKSVKFCTSQKVPLYDNLYILYSTDRILIFVIVNHFFFQSNRTL